MPVPQMNNADEANILLSFARTQLDQLSGPILADNSFLVLALSAFFFGAEAQLRKQSQISFQRGQIKLIALLKKLFNMNTRTALHLVMSIEDYAERYYLVENIISQGKKHADKWLNCEEINSSYLEKLIAQYQHRSMFDLGIEDISVEYQLQKKKMFSSIDRSVKKLRTRLMIILIVAMGAFSILLFIALK